MSLAIEAQGTVLEIGQGDALTVLPGTDVFDEVGEIKSGDGPNGSASVIDVSHLSSTRREKRMGLADEGQLGVTFNRIFGDDGQASMQTARADRELRNIKITYSDGSTDSFTAYVLEFSTSFAVDDVLQGSATFEISGAVTNVPA